MSPGSTGSRSKRALALLALPFATAVAGRARAEVTPTEPSRRAAIVATIGPRSVSVGELEDRLARVPAYQRMTLGKTGQEQARAFLEQVLVPEALLVAAAEGRGVARALPTEYAVSRALSDASLRALRKTLPRAADLPSADVQAYYDQHRASFETRERIQVWRILAATRPEADALLAQVKAKPGLQPWKDLAYQSIDKATNFRGGNLGFLDEAGVSNEAGVQVDPSIFQAALALKDGEIASAPVAEGAAFAVVSRRAHLPATHKTLAEAAPGIREILAHERYETAAAALLEEARKEQLHEVHPELIAQIELPLLEGAVLPQKPPAAATPASSGPATSPPP